MSPDERALADIAARARRILQLTEGQAEASFFADETLQDAVQYSLLVLGEAAKRLSSEFRAAHSAVEWSEIAGMRDFLIHRYHRVTIHRVWLTCVDDIPRLLAYIEPMVPRQDND
ncbi:MAG: hypothetical protein C0506_12940 [Anaerolinea sp.]|nr:hypothetical protein [Anaerolinea sp.]